MARLTMAERRKLPKSDFAVPSKAPGPGSYPMEDAGHRKAALARAGEYGSAKVKAAVKKKARKPMHKAVSDMMLAGH